MSGSAWIRVARATGFVLLACALFAGSFLWIGAVERREPAHSGAPLAATRPAGDRAADEPSPPRTDPFAVLRADVERELAALRRQLATRPPAPKAERSRPASAAGEPRIDALDAARLESQRSMLERLHALELDREDVERRHLAGIDTIQKRIFNLEQRAAKFESDRIVALRMILERLDNLERRGEELERRLHPSSSAR
jgi:hypothetical protein